MSLTFPTASWSTRCPVVAAHHRKIVSVPMRRGDFGGETVVRLRLRGHGIAGRSESAQ